ncbi:hypothetical protein JYU12_00025 [bacterium AH-315-K03]|nr:hypothetical protein [bacterium AH-315-K03]
MDSGIITDSVMFFDSNIVVKEMLYPEFEAILDHVVGIQEFSAQAVPAVFVRINAHLHVTAAVFFLINFDEEGYAEKNWNIPVRHLADHAGHGPDLGAGPIQLSCRSQCSVSWHQRSLWDPDMASGSKTLDQIASVVKRNRLGIITEKMSDPPLLQSVETINGVSDKQAQDELTEKLYQKLQKELKNRLLAQEQEHKLQLATTKSQAHDHVEKLHVSYRRQFTKLQETQKNSQQMFADEKHKNQQLKNTLESQAEKFHHDRESFQRAISENQNLKNDESFALQEKFERELTASIDRATTELNERLDMREVELFYRDEQIGRLHEDIIALRKEKQRLIDGGADRVLKKLAESGITFVAYHPGVDHLSIPIRSMAQYLESPLKYVAEKCAVDLDLYKHWKNHYELPVCHYKLDDGSICGVPIQKVEIPSHFIVGESNCCAKHHHGEDKLSAVINLSETR